MPTDDLALAVLDSSPRIPDPEVAELCRNLTVSWSRRDYRGPLFEGGEAGALLDRALAAGRRYLFLQSYGHVIARAPGPKGAGATTFLDRLMAQAREIEGEGVLGLGEEREAGGGLAAADRSLLLDLDVWTRRGRPPVRWDVGAGTLRFAGEPADGAAIVPFAAAVGECAVDLHPEDAAYRAALSELSRRGLETVAEVVEHHPLDPAAKAFLTRLGTLVTRSPEGIFPWNFEGYDDVVSPPPAFRGPVSSLYSVAAGFKPNAILHHHGFDRATRVVLVDYSRNALDIRRWLIEVWDGHDFPAVLPAMLERFPPSGTFYYLPGMEAGGSPDWERIAELWAKELDDWGGAGEFARHWRAYRELPHVYVHANLLSQPERVLEHVRDEAAGVMWWSNVFYSAYALWHFGLARRREIYGDWVRAIAGACPRLLLYGYDDLNQDIGGIEAAAYRERV